LSLLFQTTLGSL